MTVEVNITQNTYEDGRQMSRSWGSLTLDENDPAAPIKIVQPLDGRTLAVVMHALRQLAAEQKKIREDFGAPDQ